MDEKNCVEEWRDVVGFEEFYQVSNLGRVRSLDRLVDTNIKYVDKRIHKGKLLKSHLNNKGYKKVFLCKNSEPKNHYVHRLVAQAFIPNPDNLPVVNHKDENPSNNCVDNLEWCTQQYNMNWNGVMKRVGLKKRKTDEEKEYNRKKYVEAHKEERRRYRQEYHRKHYIPTSTTTKKKVSQYTIGGTHIKDYDSIAEAYNATGIRHIGCVCNGSRNSAGGYIWKWTKAA